jgi:hypothetical protein
MGNDHQRKLRISVVKVLRCYNENECYSYVSKRKSADSKQQQQEEEESPGKKDKKLQVRKAQMGRTGPPPSSRTATKTNTMEHHLGLHIAFVAMG